MTEHLFPFFVHNNRDVESIKAFITSKLTFDNLDSYSRDSLQDLNSWISSRNNSQDRKPLDETIKDYYESKKGLDLTLTHNPLKFLKDLYLYNVKANSGTVIYTKEGSSAPLVSGGELLYHMTQQDGCIYTLLKQAQGDKGVLKPYLPTIAFSNDSVNRNRSRTTLKHTGIFVFDFDKLGSPENARKLIKTLTGGIKGIKPFMIFLSPSGSGVKLLIQFDRENPLFAKDFYTDLTSEVVQSIHKEIYMTLMEYICQELPEVKKYIDSATNDVQRMTYIPFVEFPELDLYYNPDNFVDYEFIKKMSIQAIESRQKREMQDFQKQINKYKKQVDCTNLTDAEILKRVKEIERRNNFDPVFELEKLTATIDTLLDIANRNASVRVWMDDVFNDYNTLHSIGWVLYGCFGDEGIDQLKRCIPSDSNKLRDGEDSRWSMVDQSHYTNEQLMGMTPGAFYSLVRSVPELKDELNAHYTLGSKQVNDYKGLMNEYDSYMTLLSNIEKGSVPASDLDELEYDYMDKVTEYLDLDHNQLPIIEDLYTLPSQMQLGAKDFLDKKTLTDLIHNVYKDKRVFHLRAQCGETCRQVR